MKSPTETAASNSDRSIHASFLPSFLLLAMAWLLPGPLVADDAITPPTQTLSAAEATQTLQRDWLFQAMGQPLPRRTAQEIGWARDLADRLSRTEDLAPADLSAELGQLDALEVQLGELGGTAGGEQLAAANDSKPNWIWYPEGDPAADAPAESRFFRRTFDAPTDVRAANLRITADDACTAYLNGVKVGSQAGWGNAVAFSVADLIRPGRNVLAVEGKNSPAPSKNPTGLIARLTVTFTNDTRLTVISDTSWLAANQSHARWEQPDFDDSAWLHAIVAAVYGGGPWGKITGLDESDAAFAYLDVDPAVKRLYFDVRRVKRAILFKNPVLDFDQLLLVDQPLPRGPESRHEAIHRMGMMAVPGGRMLVLDGLNPGGAVRRLAPERPGSFWRPDLSFDAQKVVFCYKPHDQQSFHLYEMNLDGSGLKQLTDSQYDDVDPIYLPDGHILFTTTRGNSYVRCGPFIYSYVLARCDADGGNVYLISHNGEPDFVPSLMHDGRVIYSRWEYTDKPLWRNQSLWTTNPNGTNTTVFWGSQSVWPDHLAVPRQIPGSRRVMFCGVGHHDWWSGCVGILDPDLGMNFPHGLTKVTQDLPWPECGDGPVDPVESPRYHESGRFTGYQAPYPLSETDFLVAARGEGSKFRLYLMDVDGNRDLIYEGVYNVLDALPIKPRVTPPALPDQVAWPGTGKDRGPVEPGSFYNADVYQGVPDLPRGSAKYLRVFQMDYKTYSTWNKTYRHSGPAVSIVQEEAVKRVLSEVPVEADGSVYFTAPAGCSLYFQLLDENRRCLQTMRSFSGVMPGERRGCVGCHELHSSAPPPGQGVAFERPPTDLTPPPWGDASVSFERFVQPTLDKYCGECHQGDAEGRQTLDLTLRPGVNVFKEPYLTLVGDAGWGNPISGTPGKNGYGIAGAIPVENMSGPAAYETLRPMQYLSRTSRLVDIAMDGTHYDVKVDPTSLHKLIVWVDACCPYMGDEEIRALDDPSFAGMESLPIRPRVKTAPVIERP